MKIKEETSQRITILPTVGDHLQHIPYLGFAVLVGFLGTSSLSNGHGVLGALLLGGSIALGLHSLGRVTVHGKKCTIDKSTETVTIEDRRFMFIYRRHVLPFSGIASVRVDSAPPAQGGQWSWVVNIMASNRKFNLDASFSKEHIERLAADVSTFIGVRLVERFGRGERLRFDPKLTREKAVARFKKRMERDVEETKRQGH